MTKKRACMKVPQVKQDHEASQLKAKDDSNDSLRWMPLALC